MNGDGFLDLLSGAYWYENPGANGGEWKQHQFRTVGIHNEFVSDCGEWIVDVDHDGLPDLVTTGWISNGLWWYRNPGPKATAAGEHVEGAKRSPTASTPKAAPSPTSTATASPTSLSPTTTAPASSGSTSARTNPASTTSATRQQDGHGIGIADIDGDGKADILTTHGWFQQIDADNDKWQWHADWDLGDTGFPILGYDVNHDGKLDLIYGQGHGYGLYWLEQAGTPRHPHVDPPHHRRDPSRSPTPSPWSTSTATAHPSSSPASATAATPATIPAPTIPSSSTPIASHRREEVRSASAHAGTPHNTPPGARTPPTMLL